MADFTLPGILDPVASVAMSQTISGWIYAGVGVLVYALAGGIVLAFILKLMGSVFGEQYDMGRSFIVSILAGIIVFGLGVAGLSLLPGPLLGIIVWILLIKLVIRDIAWLKTIVAGVAGFFITRLVGDLILVYVMTVFSSLGL
jgi:hypothetical protein